MSCPSVWVAGTASLEGVGASSKEWLRSEVRSLGRNLTIREFFCSVPTDQTHGGIALAGNSVANPTHRFPQQTRLKLAAETVLPTTIKMSRSKKGKKCKTP